MLRPYKLPQSPIHEIQSFVNHLMLDVLFRANKLAETNFNSDLVLVKYKAFIDEVADNFILEPVSKAFLICKTLSSSQLKSLKRGVHNNNKIRQLCSGELEPLEYKDIEKINVELSKQIKIFCDFMYDESITKAVFYNNHENIGDYYKKIVGRSSTCRCCGIGRVLTKFHSKRSALDHYLPRKHFPFNSVNFQNLMPICDTCNSKYKLGENTIFETFNKDRKSEYRERTRAFYPFSWTTHDIKINVTLSAPYSNTIEPKDIEIDFECVGFEQEISTWDRLFGIKENYKAEYCSEEMNIYYEEQYIADINFGKTHSQYIEILEKNKYGNINFLKIPFLEALHA